MEMTIDKFRQIIAEGKPLEGVDTKATFPAAYNLS